MLKSANKYFAVFLAAVMFLATIQVQRSFALTVGEERELGEKILFQVRLAFPLLDDPDISQYINELGAEVLEVAGVQYFDYHFYVVRSSQFNAFAAPAGLVFFYSGLIEKMDEEDELVSVLAHEIGHVVSRHIATGMDQGKKVSIATTLLAVAGLALGAGALSQALLMGSLAAGQAVNLHYSRIHEEESDRLAYGWMIEMGRNPESQADMLKVMRRITRYSMGNIPQYLLTHPNPEFRLDYVQSLIAYDESKGVKFNKTDNFAFLRMKYRILSIIKDGRKLRNLLLSYRSDTTRSKEALIMSSYGLSQLDRMENNYDSSRKYLQEVIDYYPNESILLTDMSMVELDSGNTEKALELVRESYNRNRNDMWAVFQYAKVWREIGDLKQAERYLKEVLAFMPLYSKAYYELGKLKADTGKSGESAYYLSKYFLYEGRLKLAEHNMQVAVTDPSLPNVMANEIERMRVMVEKLKEDK